MFYLPSPPSSRPLFTETRSAEWGSAVLFRQTRIKGGNADITKKNDTVKINAIKKH